MELMLYWSYPRGAVSTQRHDSRRNQLTATGLTGREWEKRASKRDLCSDVLTEMFLSLVLKWQCRSCRVFYLVTSGLCVFDK